MQALQVVGLIAVVVAFVAGWVWLDRLADRWFQALPERVRERGLLGLMIDRIRRRGSDR